MAEAARIAPTLAGPEWVLGLQQTAGRGRRGRAWTDPQGNFAATLILQPDEPPAQVALRSFVAALALFDAFVTVTGQANGLSLKWPNDVLLNGGKVAGILLESLGNTTVQYLAIGIGVNLAQSPPATDLEDGALQPVSLMSSSGILVTPEEFLTALATAYAVYEQQFTTYGFAPIREKWLARAAKLGQVIRARTGTSDMTGTFETVDEGGNLVLSTAKGRVAIPAADVFF
ncbi:biotin--[acetyl-CoA-carboxylase] ligase [Sulfitobacter sp. 1151]|uniref:biotin--[biotin carboxyl-carrier protein] ligase n=2 Tax=Parasulfitobacter algicola TaxID=2614809 RepID=A0ABX2J0G1_9RHOB|nr:biotin--[acetyl-CoA-carboxylase] ligase [Sulfitobacter algicola]